MPLLRLAMTSLWRSEVALAARVAREVREKEPRAGQRVAAGLSSSSKCRSHLAECPSWKIGSSPSTKKETPKPFAWACRIAQLAKTNLNRCDQLRSLRSKAVLASAHRA